MKKYIFLFAILLASCDAPVDEPKGSGAWAGDGDETFVAGSDEMTEHVCKNLCRLIMIEISKLLSLLKLRI